MKLSDFIVSDAVIPELKASTKEEAIREMVASLVKTGHVAAEHEATIVGAIMKREELGSTGIGRGVAVPHTKHASVGSLIATVAIEINIELWTYDSHFQMIQSVLPQLRLFQEPP